MPRAYLSKTSGLWSFVSFAFLCSVAAVSSHSPSANSSGSAGVEFQTVVNGSVTQFHAESSSDAEIHFPIDSETIISDVVVDKETTPSESIDTMAFIASPVATQPLLVLKAMEGTNVEPTSRPTARTQLESIANSRDVSGSVDQVVFSSTAPAKEMHGVPSNPTLVKAVGFDRHATVTWKAPDDDGFDAITAYEVGWLDEEENILVGTQRVTLSSVNLVDQTGSNASTFIPAAELVPTSAVVESLLNGHSYTFKVRAYNVNGFSVWSAKSLAVSPLHPADLCERVSCSGHGTCFPNYHNDRPVSIRQRQILVVPHTKFSNSTIDEYPLDAACICRPGYNPPDCSAKSNEKATQYVWKVTEWSKCDSGCGGGSRSREAVCYDMRTNQKAFSDDFCTDTKPPATDMCNGIECGSKRVVVSYEVEMSYDEVLFSPTAIEAFELAFTMEVASALQIPRSRIEITALERGSIVIFFQILPASRVGEKSLNDIVEHLHDQLGNETSTLRSMGTFARRIESNGVKLSFSIADQTVAGGAEDISIAGLIGTMIVLALFVSMFAWFLRRRHYRLLKDLEEQKESQSDVHADDTKRTGVGMKRMSIKSTS